MRRREIPLGSWVAGEILAPVPHRQYVFTVPKMLRVHFRKPEVIEKILTHLGVWPAHVHSPPAQSIAA